MAIESPETIDLEAQRAELAAVLRSEQFMRAPTLANLLSYLCEKLFAGEAYQIKEYSVGVEVFHRGSSFDQDSDSIVRVEANRLRKRLAAYYAGDGASHRLQINIPLGQYVPEFRPVAVEQGKEEGALQSSLTRQAKLRVTALHRTSRRRSFISQGAMPGGSEPAWPSCSLELAASC